MKTDTLFQQPVVMLVEAVDPDVFRVANVIKRELPSLFQRQPEDPPYEDMVAIFQKHILPHHAVRRFMQAREISGARIVLKDFRKWAELTTKTPEQREWFADQLKALFLDIVKHASSAKAGRFSKRTREELQTWINGNSQFHRLSPMALAELDATEGIRPERPLVLYRGLMFDKSALQRGADDQRNALAFIKAARTGERTLTHSWEHPSSWTTSKQIADRFARKSPASSHYAAMMFALSSAEDRRYVDGELGVVLSILARPQDIVVDMGRVSVNGNHGNEGEIILRPGSYLTKVVAIMDRHGPIDLDRRSQEKHEATHTEQVLEDVAKAVAKLDGAFSDPFKGLDVRWALHPATIRLAMAHSPAIREQVATYFEALKPALGRVDMAALKDTEVHPDDPVARMRLHHLRQAMSSMAYARTDLKNDKPFSALGPNSLFITDVPLAKGILAHRDYNSDLMRMKDIAKTGKITSLSERKPAYHTFTPAKQKEHLLGVFEDAYRATGRQPPDDWEQLVAGVRSLIKHTGRLIRAAQVLDTLSKMIRVFHGAHDLTEARAEKKTRPTARDLERIRKMREEIRCDEGAGGQCGFVAEWIHRTFGWESYSGVYTDPNDNPIIDHVWNVLPDGAILDATADQIGEGHDIRIIEPSHPDHRRYRWEWTEDFNPDTDPEDAEGRSWNGEYDVERMQRLRQEHGDGWWLSDRTHLDAYREKEKTYGAVADPASNSKRRVNESVDDIPNMMGRGDREWFFWMDGHPPHEAISTGDDSHSYVAKSMLGAPGDQEDFEDDGPALDHAMGNGWVRGRFYQDTGEVFLQGQRDKVLAVSRHLYDSGKLAIRSAIIDFAELGSLVPGRSVELKDDDLMLWLAKGRLPRKSP